MHHKITLVTGIWDIGRDQAAVGWSRSFSHYIEHFIKLLKETINLNLIIFIDPTLEHLVWEYRNSSNTIVYHHTKEQFNNNFFPFFDSIQKIRNDPDWYGQASWLKDSTQCSLEYYNPMVMSKMFLLHNAKCYDPFDSDYFYWIDGGITNTVDLQYFNNPIVVNNIIKLSSKFLFICFPYHTDCEIHGFNIEGMKKYCHNDVVDRVARGGFFGGHKTSIGDANNLYYNLLQKSLNDGYMGTEESIFTIMTYIDPVQYHYEMIEDNGLLYYFFDQLQQKSFKSRNKKEINLYINTFKSPQQLRLLLDSIEKYEPKLLNETNKILINNTPLEHKQIFDMYESTIKKYNFKTISMGNIGICGSRQLAAEDFEKSSADYMLFFEDDMLLDYNGLCSMGFNKSTPNLFNNIIDIMEKEKYTFLKLSFSEFYGNNNYQWSWHNVPEDQRLQYFGDLTEKPLTKFCNIKSVNSLPYVDGEIYYSNWPHIISRDGNRKCFLDTRWSYPYEQTWMSHIYTLTRNNIVKPAILLASPITHNRAYHYDKEERKEN